MTGKYEPLTAHLGTLASAGRHSVELDFSEIAELVGGLPTSAYEHRPWWANGELSQQSAWRGAGWAVDSVSLDRQRVRFIRHDRPPSPARTRRPTAAITDVPVDDAPALDVRVRFVWRSAGRVGLSRGKIEFPQVPRVPAVYRLTFIAVDGPTRIYVGETDNLRRRVGNYRNPGPTQRTSQRIHGELVQHLTAGDSVRMSVATEAEIEADGQRTALPLARKTARVLAEHAALGLAYLDGEAEIINADRGAE